MGGLVGVVFRGLAIEEIDSVATAATAAARLALDTVFGDDMDSISKQRLLIGVAKTVACYDCLLYTSRSV